MVLETIAKIIKVQLPAYLKRLPLPETIGGFARLTVSEWLRLLPLLGILALLGYLTIRPFLPKKKKQRDSLINLKIQKENPKVVNEIDIEDLNSANVCYCRCWRSKTAHTDGLYPQTHTASVTRKKTAHTTLLNHLSFYCSNVKDGQFLVCFVIYCLKSFWKKIHHKQLLLQNLHGHFMLPQIHSAIKKKLVTILKNLFVLKLQNVGFTQFLQIWT
uniref:CDGSH iron-sulfur domain-containing protein 2 n=1 Tax=Oreochromis niloticus TaxID=8128 RepID=A0A669EHL2_ORENI